MVVVISSSLSRSCSSRRACSSPCASPAPGTSVAGEPAARAPRRADWHALPRSRHRPSRHRRVEELEALLRAERRRPGGRRLDGRPGSSSSGHGCATGSAGRARRSPVRSAGCAAARSTTRPGTSSRSRCCSPTSACSRRPRLLDAVRTAREGDVGDRARRAHRAAARRSRRAARRRRRIAHCSSQPGEPNVWMFVGVNGVGKTTTIGKLASQRVGEGHRVVLAAGDTFRAAAADQLQLWAERTGGELVRGQEGADPSSVVFDAMSAAAGRGADLVLVDTAGRLHTKKNLMDELSKLRRIVDRTPGALKEVLLVIDASTGQNGLVQAKQFADAVDVTGIVLDQARRHREGRHRPRDPVGAGHPGEDRGRGRGHRRPDRVRSRRVRVRPFSRTRADGYSGTCLCSTRSSDRLDGIFSKLRSRGRLTERDVDEISREIRLALLEADVNVRVVEVVHRPGEGARRRRRGREGPRSRPAVHQDRARGAGRDARRHHRQAHDEPEAADGPDARRPAGLGKDDRRGEARAPAEVAGPASAARRRRPAASGRGRAAARARGTRRRAVLQRADRSGERRARRDRRGATARAQLRDRRHRGSVCRSTPS